MFCMYFDMKLRHCLIYHVKQVNLLLEQHPNHHILTANVLAHLTYLIVLNIRPGLDICYQYKLKGQKVI